VSAVDASFVSAAAAVSSPLAHAARKSFAAPRTSSAVTGPVLIGAGEFEPARPSYRLNAPYPAVPTIAANTPLTMPVFTPRRMAPIPPRTPFLNLFKTWLCKRTLYTTRDEQRSEGKIRNLG
jgi:hypothetical protein